MSFFTNMFTSQNENTTPSKVGWRQLTDLGQLNEMISESTTKPVIVFKHSTRCGVSRMVLKAFESSFDMHEKVTPYFLDLLAYRSLSDAIASRFEVVHQSPQLIVIKEGKAVYNASHSDIDTQSLKQFI